MPGPVGAPSGRAEALEAPKTHFGSKGFALHSKGFALHSKGFALYSKGFALPRPQNGVEMTRVGVMTAGIDRNDVPRGQEYPCRRPGTSGGGLAADTVDRVSKIRFQRKA